MARRVILITGGLKSGKTKYALELANKLGKKTVYLRTGDCEDSNTRDLIKACEEHKPLEWQTVTEEKNIDTVLMNVRGLSETVLIDCLTKLVSNLLEEVQDDDKVARRIAALVEVIKDSDMDVIVVTNEAGGIVNETEGKGKLERVLGSVNQTMAQVADDVYLIVAGIRVKIK